uniref:Complex I assembly factor TIMMDC1, mitochondrial n=1 Tax=Riptortus pedestris TaxID=329032 RepID=R4WJL9_RIPPE|nr:conserved hypothetical protein [Riptortus pedestris]
MFRSACRSSFYFCSAVISPQYIRDSTDDKEENRLDRVINIFKKDQYDNFSPEFSQIYQTTVLSGFIGACYGGFLHSRDAYLSFIERNEAAKYTDHFEAKKKLQDHVTINFFKGALRWSWRIALFGGLYTTFVTMAAVYRGDSSLIDYVLGGAVSGFIYRINYGLNGVIVGSTLGSFVGLLAGCLTMTLLRLTGTSYDDVTNWHKEQIASRQRHLNEAVAKTVHDEGKRNMLSEHDKRINVS